jgi:hypothetical protein
LGAGYPFEPTGGEVAPGVPAGASTGVPFGPIGGWKEPGAPAGDSTGVPLGPIVTGVVPEEPAGTARIGCPSGPTMGDAPAGVVGNPFGPMGFSPVGGSAEMARPTSPAAGATDTPTTFALFRGAEYPKAGFLGS